MPPFKSESQRKFLWAKEPKLAKRWAHKYGTPKNLPEHKKNLKGMSVHPVVDCHEPNRRLTIDV